MDQCCDPELRAALDDWITGGFASYVRLVDRAVTPVELLRQILPSHPCEYVLRHDRAETVAEHVGYDGPVVEMTYPLAASTLLIDITQGNRAAQEHLRGKLEPVTLEPVLPGQPYPLID
ncbi:hypothetical protein [Dactylosporangium sp. NPDC006015]|uniref:hypothetical protein n=1 Tax=Dactylosporangium sp. NPDC006015 TaxID=3154576 RepID=UPI0033B69EDB